MAASDRQMTVSEMAEDARRDHRSYRNELWGGVYCRTDNERWPCRSTLLLDEVERLRALLAERDAEIARLKLTTRSDREYAEQKQRAEEAEGENARLVQAATALTAKSPCFVTIRPGGNDIECCQFCLTDNAHAPGCEWVGLVAALAARGGEVQG